MPLGLFVFPMLYAIIHLIENMSVVKYMCDLTLYRDCELGSSAVSNFFIDEFLSDANDAQIKVYLYLIRMTGAKKATNISDIADKFNHTEKDVCRALRYWEKKGIMSLDYDKNGGIVGIRLHEPAAKRVTTAAGVSMAGNVVAYSSMSSGMGEKASNPDSASFGSDASPLAKPAYSLDELKSFKNRQETPQLIFIAEQYLKRTLSAADVRSILFYTDELNFSVDLIDYLLQYAVERNKANFRYMDRVAIDWAEHGISTVKGAKAYTMQYEGSITPKEAVTRKAYSSSVNSKKPLTTFHNFEQNDYDFAEIERLKLGRN